jgi:hypothetical protein
MDLIEILKTFGSLSGIFAAGFLVWDRYVKHFPLAIIVPRPIVPYSQNIEPFLFLKNLSDRPILISWANSDPARLRIAKDHSVRGIVKSIVGDETVIALGAGTEVLLPVMRPRSYAEIDADNMLEMNLRWRFAQPMVWKVDRNLPISIRKRDFDSMVENYMPPTDGSATE